MNYDPGIEKGAQMSQDREPICPQVDSCFVEEHHRHHPTVLQFKTLFILFIFFTNVSSIQFPSNPVVQEFSLTFYR